MKEGSHSFADRGFVCFPRTTESCAEPLCGQNPGPRACIAVNVVDDVLSADTTCASACMSF